MSCHVCIKVWRESRAQTGAQNGWAGALADATIFSADTLLRRWNVGCAEDHSLKQAEYHLWLRNRQARYGVIHLVRAPGYGESGKTR
jgi:hypothetical protein